MPESSSTYQCLSSRQCLSHDQNYAAHIYTYHIYCVGVILKLGKWKMLKYKNGSTEMEVWK